MTAPHVLLVIVLEKLPRQLPLFPGWEPRVENFSLFFVHEVSLWVLIGTGDATQKAGLQLADQEIRYFGIPRLGKVVDAFGTCHHKIGLAVEVDVTGDASAPAPSFLASFMK